MDVPCSGDVGDQNQVEVGVPIDGEPYSSFLHTWYSSEGNRHNSGAVLCDLQEGRLCQIEVLEGRIAPTAIVVGLCKVGRAEVGSSDNDASRAAPPRVIVTHHFIARAAAQAIIE